MTVARLIQRPSLEEPYGSQGLVHSAQPLEGPTALITPDSRLCVFKTIRSNREVSLSALLLQAQPGLTW